MKIVELDHREAISRTLMTPLITCIMRPYKGSGLYTLVDKNVDDSWLLMAIAFTWDAIERNVPTVTLKKVNIQPGAKATISIDYEYDGRDERFIFGDEDAA